MRTTMQTFLLDPDFAAAQLLDSRRLGKQRVEAMQILRALTRQRRLHHSHRSALLARRRPGHPPAWARLGGMTCASTDKAGCDLLATRSRAQAGGRPELWAGGRHCGCR